jgi:hemolysin III
MGTNIITPAVESVNPLVSGDDELEKRPRLRGALHSVVAVLSIPAGVLLVRASHGRTTAVATFIYILTVFASHATSASYHRLAHSRKSREVMQRLDHAMIFLFIAGTYTPICLLALARHWGIPILTIVWTVAIFGFVLKIVAFNRYRVLNVILYPILGWVAIVCLPVLSQRLSHVELGLLIAGGVIYTAGIPVLERERPDPWPETFGYHEVWHLFTVAAAVCHFVLVALLVAHN